VVDATFVGRRLFLAGSDRQVHEVHSEPPFEPVGPVSLTSTPHGALHLAAMESWLVVAEDGAGLRFVPIAGAHACHPVHRDPGFLPLEDDFNALAVANRMIYVASARGGLLEIDARDPAHAVVLRSIPHELTIRAIAASSNRVYLVGESGLELIELGPGKSVRSEFHPELYGRSIALAGRALTIARGEEGVATFRDISSAPQTFDVSVNDDFFSPQDLSVALGDTVRWLNATGDLHNVVSCTSAQNGCGGSTATESFTSGAPSGVWELDHTFTEPGPNPYVCRPHAGFMDGSVTVTGSAGDPPGVPDGRSGAPMLVSKLASDGSTLSIAWDTTTCTGAADHEILYGYGYELPGSTGSEFELDGARCSIGSTSPFTWTGVPPAFTGSTGFVFWLVVATDGAVTEGSWGKDSSGVERQGPESGGASGECGVVVKSVSNTCPP
jgi:plastocyanin